MLLFINNRLLNFSFGLIAIIIPNQLKNGSELAIALPALLFRALSVLAGRGPVVPPEVVKPAYVDGIKSAAAANATTNARWHRFIGADALPAFQARQSSTSSYYVVVGYGSAPHRRTREYESTT